MAKAKATKVEEFPYAAAAEKEPTNMQSRFATWLEENTGYEVDITSVQLATALRTQFQNSDENQSYLAERKEAREAELAERTERKGRKGKAAAADEDDADEAPAKPARKRAAAKKTTVPPVESGSGTTGKRRRPARRNVGKAAAEETEDF